MSISFHSPYPIGSLKLKSCLKLLGVPHNKNVNGQHTYTVNNDTAWELWRTAKRNYQRLIRQHHPDKGGRHDTAAELNALWDRTERLFARTGMI